MGGRDATIEEVPWQVAITDHLYELKCGGTIIHSEWIVTSALCLGDLTKGFVRYESTRLHGYAQVVEIMNITIHEGFNRTTKDNDIALVMTQPMNLTIAHFIMLPEQGKTLEYDELLNISGFGYNGNNPPYQENLQLADVTKFDQELCLEYYPSMTTNMFCCGSPLGEVDFCRGDNGGPGTNRGILYGIPSWHQVMNICGGGTNGGIYTDVTQYVTWIKSIVPDL